MYRETEDGREHQGHAGGDSDQGVDPSHAAGKHHPQQAKRCADGQQPEQFGGGDVGHQGGADEAAGREDHDGGEQVGGGIGLIAAHFRHHVANGVRPAANLGADIEELAQHAAHEVTPGQQAGEATLEVQPGTVGIVRYRHAGKGDGQPDCNDDQSHHQIRSHDRGQLAGLDLAEFVGGHQCPLGIGGRIQLRENIELADQHASDGTDGVKRLREVQTTGGGFLRAHRNDVGVGAGLQNGETTGQHEQGGEEGAIGHDLAGRIKHQSTGAKEPESQQYPRLVAEPLDKESSGQGQTKIGTIKGGLNQTRLHICQGEYLFELGNQDIRHIICKPPQGKAAGQQNEGDQYTSGNYLAGYSRAFGHNIIAAVFANSGIGCISHNVNSIYFILSRIQCVIFCICLIALYCFHLFRSELHQHR